MNEVDCKRIEDKLENIDGRLDKIDIHLAVYNEQLKEHIRRTNILETKVEPIERHVIALQGLAKALGLASVALGVALSLLKLLGKI